MNKYAIAMLFAVAVIFTACGNGSTEAAAPAADSTQVDSTATVSDSTLAVDTAASQK